MSTSSTPRPCAACKCLRRKCTDDCVFATYFPPDQTKKFADVHSVFGASNVAKMLNDLHPSQREHATNSLVYEAESRLRDPIYGCVGQVAVLQYALQQIQTDIINGKKELATYINGPQDMLPINSQPQGFNPQQQVHPGNPSSSAAVLPAGAPTHGGQLEIRELQIQSQPQEQIFEAAVAQARKQQQILRAYELTVREQHELLRTYELLRQPKPVSFNGGFHPAAAGSSNQLFEAQQLAAKKEQQEILRAYERAIREKQEILRTHKLLLQSKPVSFNGGFNPAAVGGLSQHHKHQSFEAQQSAAALATREQQEILQTYEQQQQEKLVGFNNGFNPAAAGNSVTTSRFYQTNIGGGGGGVMSPSLAPGTFGNPYQIEPQQWEHHDHPLETQLQQLHQTQQAQSESEKGKGMGVAH